MHDGHEEHRGYHSPKDVAAALVQPQEEVQQQLPRPQEAGLLMPFSRELVCYGVTSQGLETTGWAA